MRSCSVRIGASPTIENVSAAARLQCAPPGGVPERPKGTGCKPVGSAYGGSNPPAPTLLQGWPFREGLDREELRLRLRATTRSYGLHRGPELLLGEALEVVRRLPDVVDVPALICLARRVHEQPLGRLVVAHRIVAEHGLGQLFVAVLGHPFSRQQHPYGHSSLLVSRTGNRSFHGRGLDAERTGYEADSGQNGVLPSSAATRDVGGRLLGAG